MILVFLLFFTASVFAQDSSLVKLTIESKKYVSKNNFNNNSSILLKPIKDYSSRSWNRNVQSNYHYGNSIIIDNNRKKNFIDSDLFLIVAGSAVALGTAAAYFKLKSDSYKDKFNSTNNIAFKNKSENYNVYNKIALGTLQVNFGFLIYKFLTD